MRQVFLKGNRVHLGLLDVDDAERCAAWINDEEVTQYLTARLPMSLPREREWIESMQKGGRDFVFAILIPRGTSKRSREPRHIGNIGIHNVDFVHRHGIAGIFIGDKTCWSKGYGTEAMHLLLKFSFLTLGLHRVELDVFVTNERAIASYRHCGFVQEGVRRQHHVLRGEYINAITMGVLQHEWAAAYLKWQSKDQVAT